MCCTDGDWCCNRLVCLHHISSLLSSCWSILVYLDALAAVLMCNPKKHYRKFYICGHDVVLPANNDTVVVPLGWGCRATPPLCPWHCLTVIAKLNIPFDSLYYVPQAQRKTFANFQHQPQLGFASRTRFSSRKDSTSAVSHPRLNLCPKSWWHAAYCWPWHWCFCSAAILW